jgi:hypothetical protein
MSDAPTGRVTPKKSHAAVARADAAAQAAWARVQAAPDETFSEAVLVWLAAERAALAARRGRRRR